MTRLLDDLAIAIGRARAAWAADVDRGVHPIALDEALAKAAARVVAARLNRCKTVVQIVEVIAELEGST